MNLYLWEPEPVCPKCGAAYRREIGMTNSEGEPIVCVHSKVWLPAERKLPECLEWKCRECGGLWYMETWEHQRGR